MNFAFVITVSTSAIFFCSAKFRISKWNTCPSAESKYQSSVSVSLDVCVEECSRRKHCFAAGYKRLYKLCDLYTEFTSESMSPARGQCVIVKKEDFKDLEETQNANQNNTCDAWEVREPTGTDVTCVRKECTRQVILENEVRYGNLNEIGSKVISCLKGTNGVSELRTLECSSKNGEWEIISTVEMCESVVYQMTLLYCSQHHIQIFTHQKSQPDAKQFCANIGGKLAKLNGEWKFDAIQALLRDCPALSSGQYWVDGECKRNDIDQWTFSDGTLVPMSKRFWKKHAPNGDVGDPFCMRMVRHSWNDIGDYRFDDQGCNVQYGYICEKNSQIYD